MEAAKESVKQDREEELEMMSKQRGREAEILRVLKEKSRVAWGGGDGEEGSE